MKLEINDKNVCGVYFISSINLSSKPTRQPEIIFKNIYLLFIK